MLVSGRVIAVKSWNVELKPIDLSCRWFGFGMDWRGISEISRRQATEKRFRFMNEVSGFDMH